MMSENAENVLCQQKQLPWKRLSRSHSINLPILRYIKQIEHLQENLIKAKSPAARVSVRYKLVILPKSQPEVEKAEISNLPFDTIVIKRPLRARSRKSREKPQVNEKPNHVDAKEPQKHIHPCVCDLTKKQRERIKNHIRERAEEQFKFKNRVEQVQEPIRLIAKEAEEKRREQERDRELWHEYYTTDEKGQKVKRTAARRVSMVSLGIQQFIDWKKPPKIAIRYNRVYELRKANRTYCKPKQNSVVPIDVPISQDVSFPVTKTSELRYQYNRKWISEFDKQEQKKGKYPNRPEFLINYGKLWYKY